MRYERPSSHLSGDKHPAIKYSLQVLAGAVLAIKYSGEPINPKSLLKNHKNLYQRIENYPGGWDKVVYEAGFNPEGEAVGRRKTRVARNTT